MIAIIDYGMGNVGSIQNMLYELGFDAEITSDHQRISIADKLILPGVGAFDLGMSNLINLGLDVLIRRLTIEEHKPLLGICLGMQMLGRKSEEGTQKGLSLIPFECRKFSFFHVTGLRVPHMGWDIVDIKDVSDPLVRDVEGVQRYYFVHSYYAVCFDPTNVLMTCDYGLTFTAAVKMGNIYGVQFHPEKSHAFGMKILSNYVRNV